MERKLKKLIIGLGTIGLMLFVANLIVDNPYTHRMIRAAINEKAQQHTNLVVDFESLRIHVVPLGIDLYGLYVATNVAPDQPLVTASKVKVRLSLWSLILGEMQLSLVEGHDVAAVWPPPWNFSGFLKESTVGPPQPEGPLTWPPIEHLPIDRLVLGNTKIFAELPVFDGIPFAGKWFTISTVGADLDVTLSGLDDIKAELAIKSFDVSYGTGSLIESGTLQTDIRLRRGQFKTSGLDFKSERLSLARGVIEGKLVTSTAGRRLEGLKMSLGGDVQGDLSVLGSFLDFAETRGPIVGKTRVELTVPLAENSTLGEDVGFDVEGEAQVQDGLLEGFKLFDSAVRFKVTPTELMLPDIHLMIDGHSYGHARGQIQFDDELHFEFGAEPKLLRLEDLMDALNISFRVVDTAMDSSDLVIKGTGFPLQISVNSTVRASDIVLPEFDLDKTAYPLPPTCLLDLKLGVTSTRVELSGTQGYCFQLPEAASVSDPPKSGDTRPPSGVSATTQVGINGGIDLDKQSINLQIEMPEFSAALGQYFAQINLGGVGNGSVRLHGPFESLVIDARASLANFAVVSLPLGKLTSSVTIQGDEVLLHESNLEPHGGGHVKLKKGSLKLDPEYRLAFEATAAKVSPQFMAGVMQAAKPDLPITMGFEALQAKFSGPLQHPLAWHGKLDVQMTDFSYAQEPILDRIQGVISSDDKGIRSDNLYAKQDALEIDGKFNYKRVVAFSSERVEHATEAFERLGLHPQDTLDLGFKTRTPNDQEPAVDHLGQLPFVGALLAKAEIKGEVELAAELSGAIDDLQGTLRGRLHRLGVFGAVLPDIDLNGFVKKSQVDVMFTHLGSVLEGRLSVDVARDGMPYSWYMSFNRLDVRAFGTRYFYADPRNYAYVTANWDMQGKLFDWWRSTGQLFIEDIRGKYVQDVAGQTRMIDLKQEKPARLLFSPQGWRFDEDQDLFLEGKFISLRVSLPDCQPPDRLSLKFEGIVDLAVARELTTWVDTATGKLRVVAEVIGPVSDPELVVEVTDLKPTPSSSDNWQAISIGTTEARPALRNVQMRVFYAGGRLVIDSFSANKGAGNVAASGTLNLAGGSGDESRMDIVLDNATFIVTAAFLKSFEMQLSGNLALTGNSFPYRLAGDIELVKARSTKEVDIRSEIINALRARSITTAVVKEQALLDLDLNITADRTINIHNRNMQLALSSNLQIRGTDAQPSVTGQVDVDKGKFIYKRDFVVERGIVSFDDPIKPDPALDILAVSDVDNYRVYIAITGRASQPVIEFAVDPPTRENGSPISKVEILVLLSRGALPEENRSIGETQSAATSEALNLIMGQFEEPVEKLFDLSGQSVVRNIYIDTYPSTEGNPVPRLNLPLDLGEDFDVVVRTDPSSDQVAGEYNLHENINFSATWERRHAAEESQQASQPTADTKLNLKFRFSFE